MAIYVTSNLQLGRPNAIKKYKRDFESVDQMNDSLILEWNKIIKPEDTVYHLGNFAWDPKTAQDSLLRLNGTIKFVIAEHDEALQTLETKGMLRTGVSIIEQIESVDSLKVAISYWPLLNWPGKSKGYWSIIGHPDKKHKSDPKTKTINVSTDLWSNKPQELERILEIFKDI